MSIIHDRTVHGRTASGAEIVRYDRAGKWYIEPTDAKRYSVTVQQAAQQAAAGQHYFGRPGGLAFDAKVRRIQSLR